MDLGRRRVLAAGWPPTGTGSAPRADLRVLSARGITIAPFTYYAHRAQPVSPAVLQEACLANALVTLHRENWACPGCAKLWHAARRAGFEVGRDQVGRLMAIAGITGAIRERHRITTARRSAEAPRHGRLRP